MSFEIVRKGNVEYLISTLLETPHCFTTRLGGISTGFLSSMNLGLRRGDDKETVMENYRILGEAVGFRPEETVFAPQIHSTLVERVGAADRGCGFNIEHQPGRDGTVTNEPRVALMAFGADCTTILLHDPVKKCVGALHAGWRGAVAGMAMRGVEKLREEFGSRPEDIRAAIGPCIGRCCFETHGEVPEAVLEALGSEGEQCIDALPDPDEDGRSKFKVDLKLVNALMLRRAGVSLIDICPSCTMCEPDRFWSHRATKGRRGSGGALILLK